MGAHPTSEYPSAPCSAACPAVHHGVPEPPAATDAAAALSPTSSLVCGPHCGENSRIFRDAADQTLPVTEFSEIKNLLPAPAHDSRSVLLEKT